LIVEELPFYSPYSSSSQSTSSRKSLSILSNSSSFMNEFVVKVGVRLVREIGLDELFLSLQSSDWTIASCKTIQDGEGRKMIVIRVRGPMLP